MLEEGQGIRALDPDFAKGREVEHAHALAHRLVLFAGIVEPVLRAPVVAVFALLTRRGRTSWRAPSQRSRRIQRPWL